MEKLLVNIVRPQNYEISKKASTGKTIFHRESVNRIRVDQESHGGTVVMKHDVNEDHPLHTYFTQVLHDSLTEKVGHSEQDVERYLADLLVSFAHLDHVYALKDKSGHKVTVVSDMIAEGDIRLNADSFARERQVHRYIGDFLMFWSGIFPEQLRFLKSPAGKDALLDPIGQGRLSYHIASSFTHDPYKEESRTLQKLSEGFDVYCKSLTEVRQQIVGLPNTHIC